MSFMRGFVDLINFHNACIKTYNNLKGEKKEEFHSVCRSANMPLTLEEMIEENNRIKSYFREGLL